MNNKKVGILTFLNRPNHGAVLQAYALQKKVRDLGYDCDILDLLAFDHPSAAMPELYKALPSAKNARSIRNRINHKMVEILNSIGEVLNSKNVRIKKERFEKFKQAYIAVSGQKYASVDDFYRNKMPYDIFITGSDQVWNPQAWRSSPEPYFLTFASKDTKKISYAPSFGVSDIPDEMKNNYKKWLANIDYLSVREEQGAEIIRQISGRSAEVVLDPTLLFDSEEWNKVSVDPQFKKPYILLYVLIHSPFITKLAYYLSRKTGYSIISIVRGNMREGLECKVKHLFDVGPSEFLGLFKNASFVLTSSFHGTAFSINYNKPFYSVLRKGVLNNNRVINILDKLNLKSRLISIGDDFPEEGKMSIDFSEAQVALEKERKRSLSFLANALRG